jgi:hypothetical protein
MKRVVLGIALALALTACAEEKKVDQNITQLQQQQDALSANIHKIKVYAGGQVKGQTEYTKLGPVEGFCFNIPNSTGGEVVHGDGLRAAAYRKYGNQVDAIVDTKVWFIADQASPAMEPYTENGYFECGGTAVHFASATQ